MMERNLEHHCLIIHYRVSWSSCSGFSSRCLRLLFMLCNSSSATSSSCQRLPGLANFVSFSSVRSVGGLGVWLLSIWVKPRNISIGTGKTIVEFFSAAMELRVWRYLNWRAEGDWDMTSAACFRARDARCSPSAAMTFARASRAASASAAIARCSWTGRRTSLLLFSGWMVVKKETSPTSENG